MARHQDRLARGLGRLIFGGAAGDWLTPILGRALPAMAFVLLASLTASGLGLMLPLLTKQVIDAGIMARDMGALVTWSGLAFALGLASVAMGAGNALLHLRASARMLADLRAQVLHAALARDPALPELPLGEAMARVDGDCAEMQGFAFDTVLVAVGALFRLIGGFALMALLDWRLTLLPLAAAPLELWVLSRARPRTQALAETVREGRGALSAQMAETIGSAPGLAALGALPGREAGFAGLQQGQIAALMAQRRWSEAVGAFSQILTAMMRALVLLAGGWLVVQGHWPIGTLVAYLAYAGMMSGPLRNLLGLYHAQARMRVAAARLEAVMRDSRGDEGAALPSQGEITLQSACAQGAKHLPASFTVKPGEVLLLDGPSGIGKSRLMAALTRRAPLATGQALIHGDPVEGLRPSALAAQILHLTQRPVLIRGTLAENLRLAAPEAPEAALIHALHCADLAECLPLLGSPIRETGANLSGGMRQRVALARAFLHPAPVVIFDEAFSEIDDAATTRILGAIARNMAGRTRIFIAHSGPVRQQAFDQRITLSSASPILRMSRGGAPYQREKARENAV